MDRVLRHFSTEDIQMTNRYMRKMLKITNAQGNADPNHNKLLPHDSLIAQLVKNLPAMQETLVRFLGREDPLEKDRLPTPVFMGFPGCSVGKESTYNVGDLGSIPGLGRSPGEGKGYPLQNSGLENSMDSIIHGVAESDTTE